MRPPREVRKERFSPGEGGRGGIHLDSSNGGMSGADLWVGTSGGLAFLLLVCASPFSTLSN